MKCPKCQSDTYDNTAENKQRVAQGLKPRPDYKCKNPDCDYVKWPPKDKAPAPVAAEAPTNGSAAPVPGGSDLTEQARLYLKLTRFVLENVVQEYEKKELAMSSEAMVAAVATLYIQASKR